MSLTIILLYIILGLVTFFVYRIRKSLNYWQMRGIPCEEPHLIGGSLYGLRSTRSFYDVWMNYYRMFKGSGLPYVGFYMGYRPAAFVLDINLVKSILIKDFNKFTDRGFYSNEEDDPLSGQLFLLDGHKWKSMRTKLSPTFTSGKMKNMFPIVIRKGHELIDVFGKMVGEGPVVEVKEIVARYTTDVIGSCAFGLDISSLRQPMTEFREMCTKSVTDVRHGQLGVLFLMSFKGLAKKLHMKQTPEHIEKYFMGVIHDSITQREQSGERREDFLDLLIDLKNNKMIKSEDGETLTNLTFNEVAAQAFVFLIAGFETSSTTMGFALYELAQNEDVQQRLRDEINSVLEQNNGEFSYDCLKDLTYLDQVISETLRLYTVLPVLNRVSLEDYAVPGYPEYTMKKGTPVIIPAAAIHRDADYYPDPDTFNPENFSPEAVKQRDSVLWLPFGDGPRNCIGMRFGLMQARTGIALLVKNFKFSVCSQTPIPMEYNKSSFLISSEKGINLRVEKL